MRDRRLRPLRHLRPRPAARRAAGHARRAARAERLHHHPHAEDARDHGHDRRGRSFAKMKPTAYVVNVARGGLIDEEALCTRPHGPARSPAPASTSSSSEPPHRTCRSSTCRTSSSPRTSAPRPTRRRRRPASRSPSPCGSPSAASWCRMPSTSPAASSTRTCVPASRWSRSSGQIFAALAATRAHRARRRGARRARRATTSAC